MSNNNDERESVASPTVRDFAKVGQYLSDIEELSRKAGLVITTTFKVGQKYGGDFTTMQFEYDPSDTTYRLVPITYTVTKGGAA